MRYSFTFMDLKIGNIKFNNPFFLAPLAGITDAPFRRICNEFGASLSFSEMVSSKGLYYKDKNTESLLKILDGEGNVGFQIFGSEPKIMGLAAKELENRKNIILDINMGCPVPKIVKNGEGSALLKNPDLIYDIVSEVVKNTNKPVTCKIRAGFNDDSLNYLEVANAIYSAGASAITLHARTREAYYSGKANLEYIRDLKEKFPDKVVIGNGDVINAKTAFKMFSETGCDFISIGRGSLGNPFVFKELNSAFERVKNANRDFLLEYEEGLKNGEYEEIKPTLEMKKGVLLRHLKDEADLKGKSTACKEIRKHVGWYFKGEKNSAKLRGEVNRINDYDILVEKIKWL